MRARRFAGGDDAGAFGFPRGQGDFGAQDCNGLGLDRFGAAFACFFFSELQPICGRRGDRPDILRIFEFDGGVERAAGFGVALNSFHAATGRDSRGAVGFGMQLEGYERVGENLIFGRILTAVAADGERRDLFAVRSAARVDTRDGDQHSFIATCATASCAVRISGS